MINGFSLVFSFCFALLFVLMFNSIESATENKQIEVCKMAQMEWGKTGMRSGHSYGMMLLLLPSFLLNLILIMRTVNMIIVNVNGNCISHDFQNHCIYFIIVKRWIKKKYNKTICRNRYQQSQPHWAQIATNLSNLNAQCTHDAQQNESHSCILFKPKMEFPT